jgi:uncharacterized protein (DUF433 family)
LSGAIPRNWRLFAIRAVTIVLIVLMCSDGASAYSVLTHEEIVDLLWADSIRPMLLKRYPALSEDQVREAHAYAYGGAVIQDLGYYPFGSREFSNLVHYVRSGDFVRELLLESQDVMSTSTPSHWARCRIMPRISPATQRSTSPSPSNIRSSGRGLASRSGMRRARRRI